MNRKNKLLYIFPSGEEDTTDVEVLKQQDYDVTISAFDRTEELLASDFDLVIIFISSDNYQKGLQQAQIITAKKLPLIFLSSTDDLQIMKKAQELSPYGYVIKDAGGINLLAAVNTAFIQIRGKDCGHPGEKVLGQKRLITAEGIYSRLLDSMDQAFALHEIICDENGKPVDYRFLDVNPSFERITGLKKDDIIDKTVLEVLPETEPVWIEKYGKVALTGERIIFEDFAQSLGSHYRVSAFSPEHKRFAVFFTDITKQKNAEKKLLLQSLVLDQIEDRVTITDLDGKITYVNDAEARASGYSREELIGSSTEKFGEDPEKGATQSQILEETLEKGKWAGEVVNMDSQGNDIYIFCRTRMVKDNNGNTIALAGISTDITERKKAEEELRLSEKHSTFLAQTAFELLELNSLPEIYRYTVKKLYNLFEGNSIITLVEYNHNGKRWEMKHIEGIGEKAAKLSKLLGFDINRMEGDISTKYYEQLTCGKVVEIDFDFPGLTNDKLSAAVGSLIKKMFSIEKIYCIAYGQNEQISGNITFITNKKAEQINTKLIESFIQQVSTFVNKLQAEEEVKETRDQYQSLVNNIPGITYRCCSDKDWTMLYMSEITNQITGYPVSDFLGSAVRSYASIIHPDDIDKVSREIHNALDQGLSWDIEYRIIHRDGTVIHVQEKAKGVFDDVGEVKHLEGVIFDITRRKRAEEEFFKLQQQMAQSQKLETIGNLAGEIAHDFNNTLHVISGLAEVSLLTPDLNSSTRKVFDKILTAAKRSNKLVRQLTAYARKEPVNPIKLDVNKEIEDIVSLLKGTLGSNINLIWQPGKDIGPIFIDPSQIDQIIMNTCVNAKDAITDSGTIKIETKNIDDIDDMVIKPGIEVVNGQYVLIKISDNGSGMDKKTVERIFEPFFTTKTQEERTGLGLSTVFGIVKQNKGCITVDSELGVGTTFYIYLPCAALTGEEVKHPNKSGLSEPEDKKLILVVDDDNSILELLQPMLSNIGYESITADNPLTAIDLFEKNKDKIMLLLTDIRMPGMNGVDLAAQLLDKNPRLKVILMSGFGESNIIRSKLQGKLYRFMNKPFSIKLLDETIKEILAVE